MTEVYSILTAELPDDGPVFDGPITPVTPEQARRLGRMVRAARLWRGFAVSELAARIRTSSETIDQIERGHATPDLELLELARDIADALGLSVGQLVRGEIWWRDRSWLR